MGIMFGILLMSFILGRITLVENYYYKTHSERVKFSFNNIVFFLFMMAIKIVIAFLLAQFFIPEDGLKKLSMDYAKNMALSKMAYMVEVRAFITAFGVMIGDLLGLYQLIN